MEILLITLGAGLFFVLGAFISLFAKNKKNLISFSLGISFSLLILLVFIDILPEALELFTDNKFINIMLGIIAGFFILKLLDKIVPHHHDHDEGDDYNHLTHIGIMTSFALILHNIVEGIGIAVTASASLKAGQIYAFGVALHNLPFGIKVTSLLSDNKKRMWTIIALLVLSTFAGGFVFTGFQAHISDLFLGYLLSITIGMIIYIIFYELFFELKENFNKYALFGLLAGIFTVLIGLFI